MTQPQSDLTKIKCECGAGLRVPKSAIGRKAKCPKCSKVFVIAKPRAVGNDMYDLSPDPAADSLLDGLADAEQRGAKIEQPQDQGRTVRCPNCQTDIPESASICTQCGYDKESGRTVRAARTSTSLLLGVLGRLNGLMGPLAKGALMSGLAAVIGAAVWCAIAIGTGYEFGWIAIGIGALAGFGMLVGYGDPDARAGIVASGMAVFGIVLGKFLILVFVIRALMVGDSSNITLQRIIVADALAEKRVIERGIGDDQDDEYDAIYDQAAKEVERWPAKRVQKKVAELRAQQERLNAYQSEDGRKWIQIASHRSDRRADKLGLTRGRLEREKFFAEEFEACKELTEAQIADELAVIDDWQQCERWNDEPYVFNHLQAQKAGQAIEALRLEKDSESEEDYWEPSDQEREALFKAAESEIAKLSHGARVELSQSIEAAQERELLVSRLAAHFAMHRGHAEGLPYGHPHRDVYYQEELKKYGAMESDALSEAAVSFDAWQQEGKWEDEPYVRDNLIYMLADEAVERKREANHTDDETYWMPDSDEWKELYTAAAAEVDAIPVDQRGQATRDLEQQRERRWDDRMAASNAMDTKEMAAGFFEGLFSMFGAFDLLFLVFAVSASWRIATGASDN